MICKDSLSPPSQLSEYSQPVIIQSATGLQLKTNKKNHTAESKRSHLPFSPSEIRSRSPFWTTVKFPKAWLSLKTHPWWSLLSTGSLSYNTRIPHTVRILLLEQNILTHTLATWACVGKRKSIIISLSRYFYSIPIAVPEIPKKWSPIKESSV